MSTINPLYMDDSISVAATAARDRQKKSTMACEMCRKRKVSPNQSKMGTNCVPGEVHIQRQFANDVQLLCEIFLSMCCQHCTQTKRSTAKGKTSPFVNGLWQKKKLQYQSPGQYASPTHTIEDDINRRDMVSMSSTDREDYGDSPPITWGRDRDENVFIGFLEELGSVDFDLPLSYPTWIFGWCWRGVDEAPEVVQHCLTLFFTHVNSQQ